MDIESRMKELEIQLSLTYDISQIAKIQDEMARLLRYASSDGEETWEDVPGTRRLHSLSSLGRLRNNYTGKISDVEVIDGEKIYFVRGGENQLMHIRWEGGEVNG